MQVTWNNLLEEVKLLKPQFDAIEEKIQDGIFLFGAGQFGQTSLEYLQEKNYNVASFIDNSIQKHGKDVNGINVIPLSHLRIQIQSLTLLNNKQNTRDNGKIATYSIDCFFDNIPVTFFKVDIEGFEMRLLYSAKKTILKNNPKIAICTYHKSSDIFDFIDFIKQLVPEYRFALRHHSYSLLETVLYCWCEDE